MNIYALVILLMAVSHLATDPRPTRLNGFFGDLWDGIKKVAPIGLGIIGGPIAGAAGAALGALGGEDSTLGKIGKAASIGAGLMQSHKDSSKARNLTNLATRISIEEAERAKQEFALNEPLRQAFRGAALGFVDRTNPFAMSAAQGMGIQEEQPSERGTKPVKSRPSSPATPRPATAGERF